MKTTTILLALLAPRLFAADLPPDAAELKGRRDTKIAEINQIYANELKKLQKLALKSGSLEVANTIEQEIAAVMQNPLKERIPTNEKSSPKESDVAMKRRILGSHWKNTSRGWVIFFREDGKITKSWGRLTPDWTIKSGALYVEDSVFKAGKDNSEMLADGGDKGGIWIKMD